jgi:hypothetical protein
MARARRRTQPGNGSARGGTGEDCTIEVVVVPPRPGGTTAPAGAGGILTDLRGANEDGWIASG